MHPICHCTCCNNKKFMLIWWNNNSKPRFEKFEDISDLTKRLSSLAFSCRNADFKFEVISGINLEFEEFTLEEQIVVTHNK